MNELALFAGVGGGVLGGRLLGWRSVCYVENNTYCVDILRARIAEGYLCDAPIWGDIKMFDGHPWAGSVDIITAGFPCQPFSFAGKRKGKDDSRNMWPETIRVIREVRPRYAFCENVPGLISGDHGYFGRILDDLSQSGYDARWRIVSAADVGAPHLRKRLWILADSREAGWRERQQPFTTAQKLAAAERTGDMANTKSAEGGRVFKREIPADSGAGYQWWRDDPADAADATESGMGRVAHGIPRRVDRLKAIGNAQVPGVARLAWELLTETERNGQCRRT